MSACKDLWMGFRTLSCGAPQVVSLTRTVCSNSSKPPSSITMKYTLITQCNGYRILMLSSFHCVRLSATGHNVSWENWRLAGIIRSSRCGSLAPFLSAFTSQFKTKWTNNLTSILAVVATIKKCFKKAIQCSLAPTIIPVANIKMWKSCLFQL